MQICYVMVTFSFKVYTTALVSCQESSVNAMCFWPNKPKHRLPTNHANIVGKIKMFNHYQAFLTIIGHLQPQVDHWATMHYQPFLSIVLILTSLRLSCSPKVTSFDSGSLHLSQDCWPHAFMLAMIVCQQPSTDYCLLFLIAMFIVDCRLFKTWYPWFFT